jgi:hypothetical protein
MYICVCCVGCVLLCVYCVMCVCCVICAYCVYVVHVCVGAQAKILGSHSGEDVYIVLLLCNTMWTCR